MALPKVEIVFNKIINRRKDFFTLIERLGAALLTSYRVRVIIELVYPKEKEDD